MQIFVKDLEGNTLVFQLNENENIEELKDKIFLQTGIAENCQNLIFSGHYLNSNEQLIDNSTLHLTVDLFGGKGKKKKVYTTKKKSKHHHKSEKLHALKFYNVDKNGKIQRTRKVCPQCGPGVFMAKHLDRHYCGRCTISLKLDAEAIKAAQEALKKKGAKKATESKQEDKEDKKAAKKGGKKKK